MKVNQFVCIIDDNLAHGAGEYLVGEDIPAGEYYFWGKHIWFTIISQGERCCSEFRNDAYATVGNGDSLIVKNGNFTLIDNILYEYTDSKPLYPDHVYRAGREIPYGSYFFKFEKRFFSGPIAFCSDDDAVFNKFQQYPYRPYQQYNQAHGFFGNTTVSAPDKYILLKNGVAIYCDESIPDLYSSLSAAGLSDNQYYPSGVLIAPNELCAIRIFKKDSHKHVFHGKTDAIISEQYLYTINGRKFWAGFLDIVSFKPYHWNRWVEFMIEDLSSGKKYRFGNGSLKLKNFSDMSSSMKYDSVSLYKLNRKDFFEIRLPDEVSMEAVRVTAVRPDGGKDPLQLTSSDFPSLYSTELSALATVLEKYQDIGITIDIGKELQAFEQAPDFISECCEFLEKSLEMKAIYDKKVIDKEKRITFMVEAQYDRTFYCAAKLADSAYQVKVSDNNTLYLVTFSGNQIQEISLMLSILATPSNAYRADLLEARRYLCEYDFLNYLIDAINQFVDSLCAEYGCSSFVRSSVLVSIKKAILENTRRKADLLFDKMMKENRIATKWVNEYKLFMIVSSLVEDAVYQYRAEWLGQQSFDIFIPSQNIAIEYQGQQHYEPIGLFGGAEALESSVKRDIRKRELSQKNNVVVLDWNYSIPVNLENVLIFLSTHGVSYSVPNEITEVDSNHVQMAPVQQSKQKTHQKSQFEKVSPLVIRQFDTDGRFVAEFPSISEAAETTQVSERSIRKAVYGERKTGGGFTWHRCDPNSEIASIAPVEYAKNTGIAKKILQFSMDGELIAEHSSIGQAAKQTGVSARGISDVLACIQKTAGGYIWKHG